MVTAAKELADAGCRDSEIQSGTGNNPLDMVRKYRALPKRKSLTKKAQERRKQLLSVTVTAAEL